MTQFQQCNLTEPCLTFLSSWGGGEKGNLFTEAENIAPFHSGGLGGMIPQETFRCWRCILVHSEGYRNHTEFLGNGSLDSLLTLLLAELLELETMHLHLGPTGPPRAYPEHIYHMHVYHSWLAGHVLVTLQKQSCYFSYVFGCYSC